jgi:hypothetical protein
MLERLIGRSARRPFLIADIRRPPPNGLAAAAIARKAAASTPKVTVTRELLEDRQGLHGSGLMTVSGAWRHNFACSILRRASMLVLAQDSGRYRPLASGPTPSRTCVPSIGMACGSRV